MLKASRSGLPAALRDRASHHPTLDAGAVVQTIYPFHFHMTILYALVFVSPGAPPLSSALRSNRFAYFIAAALFTAVIKLLFT
jgi:hypothetical protein